MPMWWFMFICNMIYSVVMIAGGWMMWKHCPKKINSFVGYRTSRSMRNAETWSFANQNCGRRWWKTVDHADTDSAGTDTDVRHHGCGDKRDGTGDLYSRMHDPDCIDLSD